MRADPGVAQLGASIRRRLTRGARKGPGKAVTSTRDKGGEIGAPFAPTPVPYPGARGPGARGASAPSPVPAPKRKRSY